MALTGPTFRDREKARLVPLKRQLFSERVGDTGQYGKRRYAFCLERAHSAENLWEGIREDAIDYFDARKIPWHAGVDAAGRRSSRPSNHLCCSQTSCVNTLFPFMERPEALETVLGRLGYPVSSVLPFDEDRPGHDGTPAPSRRGRPVATGLLAFEWIGKRNYLGEHGAGGRIARDDGRQRGARFTSADFAILFEDLEGARELILGEWKYTEYYRYGASKRYGKPPKAAAGSTRARTDRLEIYRPALEAPGCQISNLDGIEPADLLFDPFDQLLRLQLLASEMERAGELDADRVSVLHVAPHQNRDLLDVITSPCLAERFRGSDIHQVWSRLVTPGRFKGIFLENLLCEAMRTIPSVEWVNWMHDRYRFG